MSKLHQGRDKRVLDSVFIHMNRVRSRDSRTNDPKPTKNLSTRMKVFDQFDSQMQADVLQLEAMLIRERAKLEA